MNILLVEDDPKVARFLIKALSEEGYDVAHAKSAAEARELAPQQAYDIAILDRMLPDGDGRDLCIELRGRAFQAPVLMLTARGETEERVQGLDAGADDYMVKPFEVDELVARIRALMRRGSGMAKLVCGILEVDRMNHRATLAGTQMTLTSREFTLLVYLMTHADQTVSRADLLKYVWETAFDPGSNLVEVHVSRLREKLGEHAWIVETVRGAGYRLRSQPREAS